MLEPLNRSEELRQLAERVADSLPDYPDFSDEWIDCLTADLCLFED